MSNHFRLQEICSVAKGASKPNIAKQWAIFQWDSAGSPSGTVSKEQLTPPEAKNRGRVCRSISHHVVLHSPLLFFSVAPCWVSTSEIIVQQRMLGLLSSLQLPRLS